MSKLEEAIQTPIIDVSDQMLNMLADEALYAKLGGRYIKNQLFKMVEDYLFNEPDTPIIELDPFEPYYY